MEGYDTATYGERWAEVYDEWYDDPEETADMVAFLRDLAGPPPGPGPVVELGVGTGRVALPLAAAGYDVRGVDASAAMLDRLRAKPGGADLPVVVADMADVPVAPADGSGSGEAAGRASCAGVYVTSSTFFALVTEDDQRRCLRGVHEALSPGGWFVVAAFVPADRVRHGGGTTVGLRSLTATRVVLTADRYDAADQTVSGQYIDITEAGIRLRPVHIRYLWPDQLDALAGEAGLVRTERWATWRRRPFDDGDAHVTVYRRPG